MNRLFAHLMASLPNDLEARAELMDEILKKVDLSHEERRELRGAMADLDRHITRVRELTLDLPLRLETKTRGSARLGDRQLAR